MILRIVIGARLRERQHAVGSRRQSGVEFAVDRRAMPVDESFASAEPGLGRELSRRYPAPWSRSVVAMVAQPFDGCRASPVCTSIVTVVLLSGLPVVRVLDHCRGEAMSANIMRLAEEGSLARALLERIQGRNRGSLAARDCANPRQRLGTIGYDKIVAHERDTDLFRS